MAEITYTKKCEVCSSPIPDDYINLLCLEHYNELLEQQEKRKQEALEDLKKNPSAPIIMETKNNEPVKEAVVDIPATVPTDDKFGIKDPAYRENPEQDDKDQILANLAQFIYTHRGADHPKGRKHGILLYYPQRNMYNFIKNYCMKKVMSHPQYPKQIWKPHIVDVGCGSGVGTNILSQEAHFVWGIDKNEWSIEFAKEAFTREKNQIYYTPQVTFDVFDPMNDTRLVTQFDIVVAIEVIEHIYDTDKFLKSLYRFTRKDKKGNYQLTNATEFFISTPNRNNPKIRKDHPDNLFHVREWTSFEIHDLLLKYFEEVVMLSQKGDEIPIENQEQVILLKCKYPRI